MFFIPGELISALTFPGVMLHEWAHEFFCKRLGVAVHEVKYFQLGKKVAGYVIHEIPSTYKQTFWISVGPLLINSLVAVLLSFVALQIKSDGWLLYVFFWLAVSAGMHSFPSDQDMSNIQERSKAALKEGGSFFHYLSFPFVWLVWLGNKLRIVWFDAIWAFMLVSIGGGFNAITDDQQDKLFSQVSICKAQVAELESQTDKDITTLDNMEVQANQYKNDNDEENYNKLIDPYNTLLAKVKEESSSYETQLTACNNLVDKYNANR